MHTLLNGSVFLRTNKRGDCINNDHGLFANDTRLLSRWSLFVDGRAPQLLGDVTGIHASCQRVFRSVAGINLPADALLIRRSTVLTDVVTERFEFTNIQAETVECSVTLGAASDFLNIMEVKRHVFSRTGDDAGDVARDNNESDVRLVTPDATGRLVDHHGIEHLVLRTAPQATGMSRDGVLEFQLSLEPGELQTLDVEFSWDGRPAGTGPDFDRELAQYTEWFSQWIADIPTISGAPEYLKTAYETSIGDLAALQLHSGATETGMLPAAGAPWFMTLFGRDSLITCIETLALGPERAIDTLRKLAEMQATKDDAEADAEPGKILHETRTSALAERGYGVYYGSIDSTPLFCILADEVISWTGRSDIAHELQPSLRAAIEWIRTYGDPDGDGYLEYQCRSSQGLDNQSWKDSWDSQCFHDGMLANVPIAPAEVQGYAYDARLRIARIARDYWDDSQYATELENEAAKLKKQFNNDFWIASRPSTDRSHGAGFYALALDADKRPVDSLCSNIGHLLWSGIIDDQRRSDVVQHLVSPTLFSGFGIRTMSDTDSAFNPLSYHNGTVWPHDTALCIAGLERAGAHSEACAVAHALLEVTEQFSGRLPEVVAGLDRTDYPFCVPYPTTCSPQAWSAAAPIFILTSVLGLRPQNGTLEVTASVIPDWLQGMKWIGVQALGSTWEIEIGERVRIRERAHAPAAG